MKNYQRLKGMVAATFTPFNTDGELKGQRIFLVGKLSFKRIA